MSLELELATPRVVKTPTTLALRSVETSLTIAEWTQVGARLAKVPNSWMWWLGDWFVMGEKTYGSTYAEAMEITELAYQTLKNAAYVARNVPPSLRRDGLSWYHHFAVAPLNAREQKLWLDRALAEGWSVHALRAELRKTRELESPERVELERELRFVATTERAERWHAAASMAGVPFDDWAAEALDFAARRDEFVHGGDTSVVAATSENVRAAIEATRHGEAAA